jgi:hypothetical protein
MLRTLKNNRTFGFPFTLWLALVFFFGAVFLMRIPVLFSQKVTDDAKQAPPNTKDVPRQYMPKLDDQASERIKAVTIKRIDYLIDMLASKNAAPPIKGDGEDRRIVFPETYDKSLQVPVYLAVQQLLAENEAAFDRLLAQTNDKRYSYSVNNGFGEYNVTVSEACSRIVIRCLFSFGQELHLITHSQGSQFGLKLNKMSLAEWWEKNKQRGLAALQVEAIDSEIDFLQTVDRTKVLGPDTYSSRLPSDRFNSLREENIQILKSIRLSIIETGEPYRAKNLDGDHESMIGMPWARRLHNL